MVADMDIGIIILGMLLIIANVIRGGSKRIALSMDGKHTVVIMVSGTVLPVGVILIGMGSIARPMGGKPIATTMVPGMGLYARVIPDGAEVIVPKIRM